MRRYIKQKLLIVNFMQMASAGDIGFDPVRLKRALGRLKREDLQRLYHTKYGEQSHPKKWTKTQLVTAFMTSYSMVLK